MLEGGHLQVILAITSDIYIYILKIISVSKIAILVRLTSMVTFVGVNM